LRLTRRNAYLKDLLPQHQSAWVVIVMPAETYLFPCLSDNFGVLIHDPATGATASIDAPEVAPVEAALQKTGWKLTDILVTHHHGDHTAGIGELKAHHKCRVVAPRAEAQRIAHVDETVGEGEKVKVGALEAEVLDTPGHTLGHISYVFPADKLAFVGDTLFSIGCGRVIEGNPEMMWQSLLKLRALPDDMRFYCGHEYTDANIRFAKTVEPNNKALLARADEVKKLLGAGKATIPATIGAEKAANPFLRADDAEVAKSLGLSGSPAWKVFAEIRERKNKS
jgi:hydroxyacylglutathione hydrolase